MVDEPLQTVIRPRLPVSLQASLWPLRHGPRDPSMRSRGESIWRATRTPQGPATVRVSGRGAQIHVAAWGAGAEAALAAAPGLVGARDDLSGWEPDRHPVVRELARLRQGMRVISSGAVFETCVPVVLEQKVVSEEAHEAWWRMVWAWGEPAPGPAKLRLRPSPDEVRGRAYWAFHRLGVERRRATTIIELARRAKRLEEAAGMEPSAARVRLEAFPGVGAWTSAKVAFVCWGDADAVWTGDYHLAGQVVYALAGRSGGDDDAMLELLEPFRPHRGRAATLVKLSGIGPPRRGPRLAVRAYEKM